MHTDTEVLDDPTPRINLATSEDIRREMAKVYREFVPYIVRASQDLLQADRTQDPYFEHKT